MILYQNKSPQKIYIGSQCVKQVYVGGQLVYSDSSLVNQNPLLITLEVPEEPPENGA